MPNGFEAFAQNAMALGQQIRENQQNRRLAAAMTNFQTDPQGAITKVMQVDPLKGYTMQRQYEADQQAAQDEKQQHFATTLKTVSQLLQPAANDPNKNPATLGAAFDSIVPALSDGLGMQPDEIAKWKNMFISNPGMASQLDNAIHIVPQGGQVYQGAKLIGTNYGPNKTIQVRRGDGGTDVLVIDPRTGMPVSAPNAVPATGAPVPGNAPAGGRTTVDQAWAFTLPHEGGYAAHDANGAPVNFGINQSANPGVNVANLTADQAKQIYANKYFGPSGAANLPPALGVMHADTYYMNPARAQQFLQASGGDPQKYLQLRAQWQDNLVRSNPAKYGKFANAWDSRNQALQTMLAQNGAAGAPAGSGSGVTPVYSSAGKGAQGSNGFPRLLTTQDINDLNARGNHLDPNIQWQYDKNGMVVPVGGASGVKAAGDRAKLSGSKDIINNNLDRMAGVVQGLLQDTNGMERATGFNSYFPSIRGGAAKNWENNLDSLKSQVMINVLNNLKAVSQNGSALGRVTNYEAQNLQKDIAALDLSNSPAQMRANLSKVLTFVSQLKDHYNRAYNIDMSSGTPQQTGGMVIPQEAQDALRANPSPVRRQQFDSVFGQGAAKRVLGGQQ